MTFSQRAVEAAWKAYQDTPIDLLADSDEETKRCVVNALTAALAVDGLALVPMEPTGGDARRCLGVYKWMRMR